MLQDQLSITLYFFDDVDDVQNSTNLDKLNTWGVQRENLDR
jgi:hypothetical protein